METPKSGVLPEKCYHNLSHFSNTAQHAETAHLRTPLAERRVGGPAARACACDPELWAALCRSGVAKDQEETPRTARKEGMVQLQGPVPI